MPSDGNIVVQNPWAFLRRYTAARIALGRCGSALPTREVLALKLAQAQARDAVWAELECEELRREFETRLDRPCVCVESQAAHRDIYLRRPDLGRRLSPPSVKMLEEARGPARSYDVVLVVADGLSAISLPKHAIPTLQAVLPKLAGWSCAPIVVARHGRVAIGDEIGEILGAEIAAVFIGERPGLSAPDSLGIYLTYAPRMGRTDAQRNCISNIRSGGLSYAQAADRLFFLLTEARRHRLSGVELKSLPIPQSSGPLPSSVP